MPLVPMARCGQAVSVQLAASPEWAAETWPCHGRRVLAANAGHPIRGPGQETEVGPGCLQHAEPEGEWEAANALLLRLRADALILGAVWAEKEGVTLEGVSHTP